MYQNALAYVLVEKEYDLLLDAAGMALLCETSIQILVGAASPRLVWEGARKQGLTSMQLTELANHDPRAVHDLMWL